MKRFWTIPVLFYLLAAWLVAGCGKKGNDVVLAEIGSQKITVGDYWSAYNGMEADKRPVLDTAEARQNFLNDLVSKRIMEMSALEKYPELSDQQKRRLERVRRQTLTTMAKQILINDQIPVTKEMKDKVYENLSRERRFKAMLIEYPDAAPYVREALSRGEDFQELAKAYSVSWAGPETMGDIGWREAGIFPFPVDTLAWAADIGDTLGPFDWPLGSYLIIVLDERPHEVVESREDMDAKLDLKIAQPLNLNRQKAVLDSLHDAEDPYYPPEGLALLMTKYYWEVPPDQAANEYAVLDAQRVVPTFTAAQESVVVVDFKTAPDWTAKDFSEILSWYPMGLWPRGQTEEQLTNCMNIVVRDYLYIKAGEDLGVTEDPAFKKKIADFRVEMRVNFFYYNDILGSFEPSDEEVEAYFEANRDHYKAPPSYKIAAFGSNNRDVMEQLTTDWKNGMSYQGLREKYEPLDSQLQTIGESPWLYEGQDLRRDNVVATLKKGGVSDLIVDPGNFMVVKLIANRPERFVSLDEIKEDVQDDAKSALTDQKLSAFLAKQKEKYGVTIHENALADLEAPPPPPSQGE